MRLRSPKVRHAVQHVARESSFDSPSIGTAGTEAITNEVNSCWAPFVVGLETVAAVPGIERSPCSSREGVGPTMIACSPTKPLLNRRRSAIPVALAYAVRAAIPTAKRSERFRSTASFSHVALRPTHEQHGDGGEPLHRTDLRSDKKLVIRDPGIRKWPAVVTEQHRNLALRIVGHGELRTPGWSAGVVGPNDLRRHRSRTQREKAGEPSEKEASHGRSQSSKAAPS